MSVKDFIVHRLLKVPYSLYVSRIHLPKGARRTVLFIHGLGNSGTAWDQVIKKLPNDVGFICVDLLGFGKSPKPAWAKYDAKTQAKSIMVTLAKKGVTQPLDIVGHSLGSLVAIELAMHYPLAIRRLLLCSPPIYREMMTGVENNVKHIYQFIKKHPNEFIKITQLAHRARLVNQSFDVNAKNLPMFMATLETSILNQNSFYDALHLNHPTRIIVGLLDPLVVLPNLKQIAKENLAVTLHTIPTGHDLVGNYIPAINRALKLNLEQ